MLFWANSFITARTLVLFGFEGRKFLTILGNEVHFEKKSKLWKKCQNWNFRAFFSILQWKNQKDSADFWHRKMTLKIRIALLLIFKPKKNQKPIIFLYTPSYSWCQAYSSLNSAKLSLLSEVTLSWLLDTPPMQTISS